MEIQMCLYCHDKPTEHGRNYCSCTCQNKMAAKRRREKFKADPEAHARALALWKKYRKDQAANAEGADKPLNKMRKCHDCPAMTWNYRCDTCLAKWRAKNNVWGWEDDDGKFSGGEVAKESGI